MREDETPATPPTDERTRRALEEVLRQTLGGDRPPLRARTSRPARERKSFADD
jgi:hypothetical protein